MKFEVEGDTKIILKILEEYEKVFSEEYDAQVKKAKDILGIMGMERTVDALPKEWSMFFWEENGKVIINIPIYMPRLIKMMGKQKKMANNFKEMLTSQGVEVKSVKFIGD
jgi:hypothetical protein